MHDRSGNDNHRGVQIIVPGATLSCNRPNNNANIFDRLYNTPTESRTYSLNENLKANEVKQKRQSRSGSSRSSGSTGSNHKKKRNRTSGIISLSILNLNSYHHN